jgi:hypothetical protein
MTTIACTLSDDDRRANQGRWHALGARALLAVDPTDRGLRLAFARTPAVESELRALAEVERECCAFAVWTVSEVGDRILLDAAGKSDDAVPAVKELFRSLRA